MIENKTYFVNEIIINEQIWKQKAINRPVEANSNILDLSKKKLTTVLQIVLKLHKHYQPLLLSSPCVFYCWDSLAHMHAGVFFSISIFWEFSARFAQSTFSGIEHDLISNMKKVINTK